MQVPCSAQRTFSFMDFFSGKETSPDGTVSDDSRKMWSQSLVIRGSRLEKLKMHDEQGTEGEILQE